MNKRRRGQIKTGHLLNAPRSTIKTKQRCGKNRLKILNFNFKNDVFDLISTHCWISYMEELRSLVLIARFRSCQCWERISFAEGRNGGLGCLQDTWIRRRASDDGPSCSINWRRAFPAINERCQSTRRSHASSKCLTSHALNSCSSALCVFTKKRIHHVWDSPDICFFVISRHLVVTNPCQENKRIQRWAMTFHINIR